MTLDFEILNKIKGFIDNQEAKRLYKISLKAAQKGPILEIGSYCGKSAYIIGSACKAKKSVLFSIDHHKGSQEHQPNEDFFDSDLFDEKLSRINTLPFFQQTLCQTLLEETVVMIVADSKTAGKKWKTPVSMLFIDGGHSYENVYNDYIIWEQHIKTNGFLVIHDIFYDDEKGGQAPRQIYEKALGTKRYKPLKMIKTLGVLQKLR